LTTDGLKLYSIIQTRQELHSSLDALVAWSDQWQLSISSKKSAVLYLGQNDVNQCYVIKQASVSRVLEIRDLGILIDNKLTMSQHICNVVKKAQTRASLIFKCFHSRHRATLLKAFITYVQPLLKYATPVRTPYSVKDVTKIESVQQSFTNRLPGLSNLPYTKHL